MKTRVFVVFAALLFFAALVEADGSRLGWHGESMPAGLERGTVNGTYVWSIDGSEMVYVPAGEFVQGSTVGDPDEEPQRRVWLSAFYIDKYELSWGQWKLSGLPYSERTGLRRPQPEPPDWGILDDHPVLNVTWPEAMAYVKWAGKNLPTEAQWEKAARGTDGHTYPWGDQPPTPARAVWKGNPIALKSTGTVTGTPLGASPYGALNMAGNVYEWCLDTYARDFYSRAPDRDPVNLEEGRYKVLRGGAFVLELEDLRSALRYRLLPLDRAPYIGFRAALPEVEAVR